MSLGGCSHLLDFLDLLHLVLLLLVSLLSTIWLLLLYISRSRSSSSCSVHYNLVCLSKSFLLKPGNLLLCSALILFATSLVSLFLDFLAFFGSLLLLFLILLLLLLLLWLLGFLEFLGLLLLLLLLVSLLLLSSCLLLESLLDGFVGLCLLDWGLSSGFTFFLELLLSVGELLELCEEETVHVVSVRIDTSGQIQRGMEPLLLVASETWLTDFTDTCVNELHESVAECEVNDPFVLFYCD